MVQVGCVLLFVLLIGDGHCAKILGIWPEQISSHFVMFERLMKGLVERGHEVDVLSHFPQQIPIKGYNDMSVRGTLPSYTNNLKFSLIEELGFFGDMFDGLFREMGVDLCNQILKTDAAKKLQHSTKKYDLLITELFAADCFLGYSYKFKIPSIVLTTSVNLPWGSDRIGNPDNPSYIPNYFTPYSNDMNIFERLLNTILLVITKIGYDYVSVEGSNPIAKEYFGEDLPDLRDLAKNVSLVLVNSHFSINFARPTVPNFIEVGGLHIKEPKQLIPYFEELLKTKQKGVIYLSMGSMLKTESMPEDKLQAIFDVFAEIPYKVLWKAGKEGFNKSLMIPNNIQFEAWLPQMEILCHPNVKLFISHGGLMGSQEAIHCAKPLLGIPIFADQELNVKSLQDLGIALKFPYKDINKPNFKKAILQILENSTYNFNSQRISRMFKDRPADPLTTAIYWVEYVIRHQGAPQLRSKSADIPWYKYYLLDIIVILIFTTLFFLFLLFSLIKCLCRPKKNSGKTKWD